MLFSSLVTLAMAGLAAARPLSLSNGFPNPSPSQLKQIQMDAGGTLPDTALPTNLTTGAIQTIQVLMTNELFEVAYFTSLLHNVSNNVPGYTDLGVYSKQYVMNTLTAVIAQEQLHATGLNAILASAGGQQIGACDYQFPVSTYKSAIALAATFTDLVVGTLATVQQQFALDGGQAASGLVPLVGSIIGQESEQIGGYRAFQQKVPSSSPFLTSGAGTLAYSAVAQLFIVPNSCSAKSNVSAIGVTPFAPLALAPSSVTPSAKNSTLTFITPANVSSSSNFIAYISGQNAPIVRPITSVNRQGGQRTFQAHFPFGSGFSRGLTIAALVNSQGPFTSPGDVAAATVAGPGLIEID